MARAREQLRLVGRAGITALFCWLASLTGALSAGAETRVALVIGNGAYQNAPRLANPVNDAHAVTVALERLDFAVMEALDLDIAGLRQALSRFAELLVDADVGLFFYAGHGLQVRGQNYLVPTDAALNRETDLIFQAVDFTNVLRLLEDRPRTSLVFLDACRDNPLARSLARNLGQARSQVVGRGLAQVEAGIGTLIAYATQPGNVASDGSDDHSPFTAALLANIETPSIEVRQMLTRVRKTVIEQTAALQVPWDHSSLTGDFYFKPPEPPVVEPPPALAGDVVIWKVIEDSTDPEDFETFLEQYSDSALAPFARKRLTALRAQEPGETTAAQTTAVETAALTAGAPDAEITMETPTASTAESVELALGWSRDDWREVQRALNALAHPAGPEDGLPGRQTRTAVTAWQRGAGVERSGYLTAEQRTRLLNQAESQLATLVASKPPPSPSPRSDPVGATEYYHRYTASEVSQLGMVPMDEGGTREGDSQAVAQLRTAAEHGLAPAQYGLGSMYLRGRGVPQDDVQAVTWYRKAAEQGLPPAQYDLGTMYLEGRGVPQDDVQAVVWFRKAAEQGFAPAQSNLGSMYQRGRGVPQDDVQAVVWFRKAAAQGLALAQSNLAAMYMTGRAVPQN